MNKFRVKFNLVDGKAIKTTPMATIQPLEEALEADHITRFEDGTSINGKDIRSVEVEVIRK